MVKISKSMMMRQLIQNMGWRYLFFRLIYTIQLKSGWMKKRFPTQPTYKVFIEWNEWKKNKKKFLFQSKYSLFIPKQNSSELLRKKENFDKNIFLFFSSTEFNLGNNYDWITNPETKFKYNIHSHWSQINDYSQAAGDIKYVWEKARFSYILNLLRYDYHFDEDQSRIILNEILDFIDKNPINCGPNYKCSQEISIRSINWLFTLYYYSESNLIKAEEFEKIMHVLYWNIKHVYDNISFSRISVRNNHAVTECMAIYIFGLLFPWFPEADKWKKDGKKWFEEEIEYQVYEDGTFLQFSMNYHRVMVQLFSIAIRISELNNEVLSPIVYQRAQKSLEFLTECMQIQNGELPNYGANDGALFFPLNDCNFRDYSPQLEALANIIKNDWNYSHNNEDVYWYGLSPQPSISIEKESHWRKFENGGYYTLKHNDAFTFIRSGNHKDRPSQSDNLHLDIWVNGENIFRDSGSYKYNSDSKFLNYFMGNESHNSVMLGEHSQMLKGGRFIWYYWTQSDYTHLKEDDSYYYFEGQIKAFQYLNNDIRHIRKVRVNKHELEWIIDDQIIGHTNEIMRQLWHPNPNTKYKIEMTAKDSLGNSIDKKIIKGYYSGLYGIKEACDYIDFSSSGKSIQTSIRII